MKRRILAAIMAMLSLLLVLPVEYDREDPGLLVKVLLWIDEHVTGGHGEEPEDPPPTWGGGPSPDWDE